MSLFKRYQKKSNKSLEHSFTEYMNESMDFSYSIARKYLNNDEEIQDAIQSTYIKAWTSFNKYDPGKSAFTTWLFTILKNECLDRYRKSSRQPEISSQIGTDADLIDESAISDTRELYYNILKFADKLSKTQHTVFILRDIQGLSVKEVAQETGISEGSIKSNLHLARKNIRQWMIEQNMI